MIRRWPVAIVGVMGGQVFGRDAEAALADADVVIGSGRHLNAIPPAPAGSRQDRRSLGGSLTAVLDEAAEEAGRGRRVVVLASGDPGFFGLVRLASLRLGPGAVSVYPAPSSVSLAFARLAESWDDARVVSAHGRPLAEAVDQILSSGGGKVAVLTSPESPPELLGQLLAARGAGGRRVAVCSQLGTASEKVTETEVAGLAAGGWDPLSVVVLRAPAPPTPTLAWGRPDDAFAHRGGMITKAEVRAVALGKLAIPRTGVCWDVGAGSGSVAAEIAGLAPGLAVYAVERRADDLERLRANVAGTSVTVVAGEAPAVLRDLPDPDRVFVGGGGLDVLDAALARLRPGGTVVATYAALERAVAAAGRLGQLVQVAVSRGVPLGPDRAMRLEAENPVFVCWGPVA